MRLRRPRNVWSVRITLLNVQAYPVAQSGAVNIYERLHITTVKLPRPDEELSTWHRLQNLETRPTRAPDVANVLPLGYEKYGRVFHRWMSHKGGLLSRWAELAAEGGVIFHEQLTNRALRSVCAGAWFDCEGEPDEVTRAALFDALSRITATEVYAGWDSEHLYPETESVVLLGPLHELALLCAQEALPWPQNSVGPQYMWSRDWAWALHSDYDLTSTYIGCSAKAFIALSGQADLELLEVQPSTRVDDFADHKNRPQDLDHWN
jgi:hypothetical protein